VTPGGEDDDGAKALEARSAPRQQKPEPVEPATDHAWFTEWQERVRQADSESRLINLWQEVAAKARNGQVHPEDMDSVASPLFRERRNELRQPKQEALS
jgi:MoxR-like ATPase